MTPPLLALFIGLVAGILVFLLSPVHVVAAAAGVAVFATILRRPVSGLELFAFLATLLPFSTVRLGVRITVSEAVLAITWIGVILHLLVGQNRPTLGPTERVVAWFALFSVVPFVAGELMVRAAGNGFVHWVRWLLNLSAILLVPILLETRAQRERVLWLALLGTGTMLLFSITLFLRDHNALTLVPYLRAARYAHPQALHDMFAGAGNDTRLATPWIDPNNTGGALAMLVPIAVLFATTRTGAPRALARAVLLLALTGIMLSGSRGAMVSVGFAMLWLAHRRVPGARQLLVAGLVLGVAAVLLYAPLRARMMTIFSARNPSTVVRLAEYRRFPAAVADYPLGIGFKVSPPVPGTRLLGISNLWLDYMYKLGFIGMLIFVRITWVWWREVRPGPVSSAVTRDNAVSIAAVAACLTALFTGVFDHYFSFTMVLIGLFWMIMGIGVVEARSARSFGKSSGLKPLGDNLA